MKYPSKNKGKVLGLSIVFVFCLTMFTGYTFGGLLTPRQADTTITIEPGSFQDDASYIVYVDGANIKAKNCTTGEVEFSDTDASTVIQDALDGLGSGGGLVFIKAGSYTLTASLNVSNRGAIKGEINADYYNTASELVLGNGVNDDMIKVATATTGHAYVGYLALRGNKAQQSAGCGIDSDAVRTVVEHVSFDEIHDDAIVLRRKESHVTHCRSDGVDGNAIHLVSLASDCFVAFNDMYAATNGLYDEVGENIITANNFFLCGQYGIYLSGTKSTVDGNRVNACGSHGINVGADHSVITDNRVEKAGKGGTGSGILINADDCVVTGNMVWNSTESGIKIAGVERAIVSDNVCVENYRWGIYLYDSVFVVIEGNLCMNNGKESADTYDGIFIDYYSATTGNITVIGNICSDDGGTLTQQYGINIDATTDYLIVMCNICMGNLSGGINNNSGGSHNIVCNNTVS